MKGKFRSLGAVLMAAFVVGAVAAQGAWAHTFESSSAPYVMTGELDGASDQLILSSGLTVSCESAVFEGTVANLESTGFTVTPTYGKTTGPSGCATNTGNEAVVHTNHCAYVFSSETNAEGHAPLQIECAGATDNEISVTLPTLGVTFHIPPQTPQGGAHYTNIELGGHEAFTSHTTAKELAIQCTGGACVFVGGENQTATYTGTEKFRAYKHTGSKLEGTERTTPTIKDGEQLNVRVKGA